MRDGKVFVPVTISKGDVLQDLEFYGLMNIDESSIDESIGVSVASGHVMDLIQRKRRQIQQLQKYMPAVSVEMKMEEIALMCFLRWTQNGSTTKKDSIQVLSNHEMNFEQFKPFNLNLLNASLSSSNLRTACIPVYNRKTKVWNRIMVDRP
jgi:hypothetical protein